MTTWADIKAQLVDLGFEEDSITNEYGRIMINSVNRALDIVYDLSLIHISEELVQVGRSTD